MQLNTRSKLFSGASTAYGAEPNTQASWVDVALPGTLPVPNIEAIRKASIGESAWTRDELRRVTGALATPRLNADVEVPLTQRESEVLRQLALGLTNKEIAQALHISYETVKEHVQHILRKIGVSDRTQAAVWAVRKGLVQ